jgi:transcriptional regulator with XRE-family HTH domain
VQNQAAEEKPNKRKYQLRNPEGAKILGARMRELRQAKKWSRQRLATESEVEISTVKRIEFALASPTIDVLISICRALGVQLYELVQDDSIVGSDGD